MATNSATVRYASRRAVSGSNAYDLSRIRDNLAPEMVPVRKPVEKPAIKNSPKTVRKPAAKPAARTQRTYGVSLFAVTGVLIVAVMMVFVLLAQIKYNEVTNDTVALQTRLDTLTEQERKLRIDYENAFDVNDVAQYATNVLGMSKLAESQVGTVETTSSDKAVVVHTENEDQRAPESMVTFLASLVAYFK